MQPWRPCWYGWVAFLAGSLGCLAMNDNAIVVFSTYSTGLRSHLLLQYFLLLWVLIQYFLCYGPIGVTVAVFFALIPVDAL